MTDSDHSVSEPAASDKPRGGRPRRADPPRFPHSELDRLLVFGEVVDQGDGRPPDTVFPSYRELGSRFGIAHSVVADFSRRHDCLRRRQRAQHAIHAKAESKLVEARASALAIGREDALRIVDKFLRGFEAALDDGRVRTDSAADLNTILRLREFLVGGPDFRKELAAGCTITLEMLQERYANSLRRHADSTPALAGIVPPRRFEDGEAGAGTGASGGGADGSDAVDDEGGDASDDAGR
ncbi:MAG: hypothetical protein JW751_30810 [Polyangiaceae bacterium]|nr:hypothetical protein [Polyangiaceae bacterium]